jgi:fumarylacetoacetate (FAA) hydrolase
MLEKIATGEITTAFLQAGDKVKIEMRDNAGDSIFGAIEQRVTHIKP